MGQVGILQDPQAHFGEAAMLSIRWMSALVVVVVAVVVVVVVVVIVNTVAGPDSEIGLARVARRVGLYSRAAEECQSIK